MLPIAVSQMDLLFNGGLRLLFKVLPFPLMPSSFGEGFRDLLELRAERAAAGRTSARARGKTGGRPRTDVSKLENARILYENSGKTAAEACAIAGVGRRIFFTHLAAKRKSQLNSE